MKLILSVLALIAFTNVSHARTRLEIRLPRVLDCKAQSTIPLDQEGNFRIYPRAGKVTKRAQLVEGLSLLDNTGSGKGVKLREDDLLQGASDDYFSMSVDSKTFEVSTWTCDSWDYIYTFQTEDLIIPVWSGIRSKTVKGTVHAEVRDIDEGTTELTCTARY